MDRIYLYTIHSNDKVTSAMHVHLQVSFVHVHKGVHWLTSCQRLPPPRRRLLNSYIMTCRWSVYGSQWNEWHLSLQVCDSDTPPKPPQRKPTHQFSLETGSSIDRISLTNAPIYGGGWRLVVVKLATKYRNTNSQIISRSGLCGRVMSQRIRCCNSMFNGFCVGIECF